ncbi:hypothetical protein BJY04DRAFT_90105 [Aspergillus karnatakaensis]|uniref:uncharacterized protein n=1 Tax=Aspergillus karnatakaensis TaxID=1810916 RepID=UPI003CCE0F9B
MEHVSTLCAISTVGIAATGFALGRVERAQSLEPTHLQHAPLLDTSTIPSFDPSLAKSFAKREIESPLNPNFPEFHDNAVHDVNQVDDSSARRKSSFAGIRLRRRGQTLTLPTIRTEEPPPAPSHARRPSSLWIRRLSFQPEKRLSVQSPISPSFPEPASPASSRLSSQRRAPNKLVKRPKSQHSNANPIFAHTISTSLVPSGLRRPATSYQRSENFRHKPSNSLSFEPSLALTPLVEPDTPNPGKSDPWQPYIVPNSNTPSERPDRTLSTATKPHDLVVRRILPQPDVAPALLLGTSITQKPHVAAKARERPGGATPIEFRDPFSADASSPPEPDASLSKTDTCHPPSEETCPKSLTESTTPLDIRVFRNGSFTGPKRRAISTPLPNLANVEGAIWVSPRAGRRNITDPNIFRRPPTTSPQGTMPSQSRILSSYRREYTTNLGQYRYRDFGQPASTDASALSSLYGSIRRHPKRHSIAASDPASTVIGSDDTRIFTSGDEDETDFLTDTAFDSIRTHITTDSSCFQSPRIESIFNKHSTSEIADESHLKTDTIISSGSLVPEPTRANDTKLEEEGFEFSVLTPVTREVPEVHEGDSEVSFPSDLSDDEDSHSMVASLPGDETLRPSLTLAKFGALSLETTGIHHSGSENLASQSETDSHHQIKESIERDSNGIFEEVPDTSPRMNIFDWSEQPRPDRENSGPDGRPRTVHGKQGPGMRGSRTTGRKPPSTLHYRSQSVPVAREPPVSHDSRQSSGKFGTWGLGSKGVSEDWDSDFEFEDREESAMSENINPNKAVRTRSVIVPPAILERQASLHGQFGQVQELTLLVEELKRLRHQASFLDIVRGPSNDLWKEAEGIVDLATLDDDDNNQSPPRSPSSLTFSFDESEGESSHINDPWKRASGESWKASFLENPTNHPNMSSFPDHMVHPTKTNSVLDLIYQQRLSQAPATFESHPARSKKLPFDTQSLRDLVIRAGVVTRALKEVVRKAEGVTGSSEENTRPSHPPFSRIFEHPSHDDISKFETSCIS